MKNPYDAKIKKLSVALVKNGISSDVSLIYSYGIMDKLRRKCWSSFSDVLGLSSDIEALSQWNGAPGKLTSILLNLELIGYHAKIYYMPTAVCECSEYTRRKWKRDYKKSYDIAVARKQSRTVEFEAVSTASLKSNTDLFGDEPVDIPPKSVNPKVTVIRYWCSKWQQKYNCSYPFMGRDGKAIQSLLDATGSPDKSMEVIDNFLACNDNYLVIRSHNLSILLSNLPRYIVRRSPNIKEIQYAGRRKAIAID